MAHLAVAISNLVGRMNSGFALISRLEKEGHRITVVCQPEAIPKAKKQGFTCLEIPELNLFFNDPGGSQAQSTWFKKLVYHIKNLPFHYKRGKALLNLEKYEEILGSLRPDCILVDVELHELILASLELKIPITLFHTWYSDKISLDNPPIRTFVIPGSGFQGSKTGILLAWLRIRVKVWGRIYMNKLNFKNYRRAVLKKYSRQAGLSSTHLMANRFPPLFSYKKLPILTLAMRELEFPHRPAKNLIYVGPMVYENREDLIPDPKILEQLNSLFSLKRELKKKLIYCSVSSYIKGDLSFLKKVIKAVEN